MALPHESPAFTHAFSPRLANGFNRASDDPRRICGDCRQQASCAELPVGIRNRAHNIGSGLVAEQRATTTIHLHINEYYD